MVKSMSILWLWDIQLTLDWDGIEPYDAHPHKFDLKRSKWAQKYFESDIFLRKLSSQF